MAHRKRQSGWQCQLSVMGMHGLSDQERLFGGGGERILQGCVGIESR